MKRSTVRRSIIACIIGAMVSVGVGTAVADDPTPETAPVMSPPLDGEQGAYTVQLKGDWNLSNVFVAGSGTPAYRQPWEAIRFAWSMQDVATANGVSARMQVIDMDLRLRINPISDTLQPANAGMAYHAETAYASWLRINDTREYTGLAIGAPSPGNRVQITAETMVYDASPHCWFGPALSRLTLQAGETTWPMDCVIPALGGLYTHDDVHLAAGDHLRILDPVEVNGIRAWPIKVGSVEAWLAPHVSAPLRYIIHEGDRRTEATLTGHLPGTQALASHAFDAEPRGIASASRPSWGIPGGEALGLPVDVAYASLQQDEAAASALARGQVIAVSFQEVPFSQDLRREWVFTIADGSQVERFMVREQAPAAPRLLLDALPRDVLSIDRADQSVTLDSLPQQVPTLVALAHALDIPPGQINRLDLDLVEQQVIVGRVDLADYSDSMAGSVTGRQESSIHLLAKSFDGDTLWSVESATVQERVVADAGPRPAQNEQAPLAAVTAARISSTEAAAIGLFGLMAGALYMFWPVLKAGPVALFSRLRKPELLEHPTRQMIVDAVTAQPGIHLSDLARLTGLANGTMRHHIDHLVRNEVLIKRTNAGYTCLFLKATDRRQLDIAPLLRSEGARTVLEAVRANPGVTGKEVAALTGLANGTVGYHIRRLGDAGAIQATRQGRKVALTAA